MTRQRTYESDALAAIHETVSGLYESGLVDKKTMRKFDRECLTPIKKLSGNEIKELRDRERVSQKVLALYLNVPAGLVSQWERDIKTPSGASLKLLNLVREKGIQAIA